MDTKLVYMEFMDRLADTARVESMEPTDGKTAVVLDRTIFYPQGGGQRYDTGTMTCEGKRFRVTEVRYVDGSVKHYGTFEGMPFAVGDTVSCAVDGARRLLNSRLHSAGHVLDMAQKNLGIGWVPGKGYHFPDGPYVEYEGDLGGIAVEKLRQDLEAECAAIIATDVTTKVRFTEANGPGGKPGRVVMYGDFSVPCGGTHVANLGAIGKLTIRSIKPKSGKIRVGYEIGD